MVMIVWTMQSPIKSLAEDTDSVEQNICPCCGADLMIQEGFCNENSFWICKVCGEMLINPEIEDTE